jgi:hypothetical protein
VRREVHHRFDGVLLQDTIDRRSIAGVADHQGGTEHGARVARREVVEDHDPFAALDELADDVAADVTGTAGDEDGTGHAAMLAAPQGREM